MPKTQFRDVEPGARLLVNDRSGAVLLQRVRPTHNADVLITDDIRASRPTWRTLDLVRFDEDGTLRCRDAYRRSVRLLRWTGDDLWVDEVCHHPTPACPTRVAVLPAPRQRVLQHVYEVRESGVRIALYADPNRPLSRAVWVRIGSRRTPSRWHWAKVEGVSQDEQAISTSLGQLDMAARSWAGAPLRELPPRTHGIPLDDAWLVLPARRSHLDRPSWRLTLTVAAFLVVVALIALMAL